MTTPRGTPAPWEPPGRWWRSSGSLSPHGGHRPWTRGRDSEADGVQGGGNPPLCPHPEPPCALCDAVGGAAVPWGFPQGSGPSSWGCSSQQIPSPCRCPPHAASPRSLQLCTPAAPCQARTPPEQQAQPRPHVRCRTLSSPVRPSVPACPQPAGMPEKCHAVAAGLRAPVAGPALHSPGPILPPARGAARGPMVRGMEGGGGGGGCCSPSPVALFYLLSSHQ